MFKIFQKNKYSRGITMVELIVVISIFLILTSITIFNYGQFRSSLSIQNLADDISLVIRKAQSYSTGVQGIGTGTFSGNFGVHFTTNISQNSNYYGSNKQFILFFDQSLDMKYDYIEDSNCGSPVVGNECFEAFRIKSNDIIEEISYYQGPAKIVLQKNHILNILFQRPKTEPIFCRQAGPSAQCVKISPSYIEIKISSINEPEIYRYIKVYNSGQISVSR